MRDQRKIFFFVFERKILFRTATGGGNIDCPSHSLVTLSTTVKAKKIFFFVEPMSFHPIQLHTTARRKKNFSLHTPERKYSELLVLRMYQTRNTGHQRSCGGCWFCLHQHPAAVGQHDWLTGHVACPNRCPPVPLSNCKRSEIFFFMLATYFSWSPLKPRDCTRSCVMFVFRTGTSGTDRTRAEYEYGLACGASVILC